MIIPDKNYDAVKNGVMHTIIKVYREGAKKHVAEEWDCDDIARDFWCFAKHVLADTTEGNGIVGRVIFPDHAEIIYAEMVFSIKEPYQVYYIDQRDWSIRKPNKKPKWIEL